MAIRRAGEAKDEKAAVLRVTFPKRLLLDIRETRKACAERGLVFDIRPEVEAALTRALSDAKKALNSVLRGKG